MNPKFFKGLAAGMLVFVLVHQFSTHIQNLVLFDYYDLTQILESAALLFLLVWLLSTEEWSLNVLTDEQISKALVSTYRIEEEFRKLFREGTTDPDVLFESNRMIRQVLSEAWRSRNGKER